MAAFQGGGPYARRSRGRIVAAVVGGVLGVVVAGYAAYSTGTGIKTSSPAKTVTPAATHALHESLPSTADSYLGVYEFDSPGSYSQVEQFAQAAGRQPNLALYYSSWGEPFQESFASSALANGATVIVDLDPDTPTNSIALSSIVAGKYDSYLETYARSVLSFGHPVVMSFGHEMNGNWYPWGWTQQSPKEFVKAWQHVVTVFRDTGADNVTWLWTFSDVQPNTGPLQDYWPGNSYVNWVGIDSYYYFKTDTFDSVFNPSITAVRKVTNKPILIAETAVGPIAGQPTKIQGLLAGIKQSGVLGFVWFDDAQNDGVYHQDWRLEGNAPAVAAFRSGLQKYFQ
jgi:hypothetical protein